MTGQANVHDTYYSHDTAADRKAETELRSIVERNPVEHYAHLMLGRTSERQGRGSEAVPHLRLAAAPSGDFPD